MLKCFTFSGIDPPRTLTKNGENINVASIKWYPKNDKLQHDMGELHFARKHRGKKPKSSNEITYKLARRHCAVKVGEIFDLTGKIILLLLE